MILMKRNKGDIVRLGRVSRSSILFITNREGILAKTGKSIRPIALSIFFTDAVLIPATSIS
jgi:hypothetical protein